MSNTINENTNYYYDENNNKVTLITPEDMKNAEVKVVINFAEVMEKYPKALKESMENGIRIGKALGKQNNGINMIADNSRNQSNAVPVRQSDPPPVPRRVIIAVADMYSYAAYTNSNDYERGKQFFHAPTVVVGNFTSFDEAINWAYNECCKMNPSKRFPLLNKKNWRIMVKNIEDRGDR